MGQRRDDRRKLLCVPKKAKRQNSGPDVCVGGRRRVHQPKSLTAATMTASNYVKWMIKFSTTAQKYELEISVDFRGFTLPPLRFSLFFVSVAPFAYQNELSKQKKFVDLMECCFELFWLRLASPLSAVFVFSAKKSQLRLEGQLPSEWLDQQSFGCESQSGWDCIYRQRPVVDCLLPNGPKWMSAMRNCVLIPRRLQLVISIFAFDCLRLPPSQTKHANFSSAFREASVIDFSQRSLPRWL